MLLGEDRRRDRRLTQWSAHQGLALARNVGKETREQEPTENHKSEKMGEEKANKVLKSERLHEYSH